MIMTLNELKLLVGIPAGDTSNDDYLNEQLDILEDAIVDYTYNRFQDNNTVEEIVAVFDKVNKTITAKSFDFGKNYYYTDDQIRVVGSRRNDGVYTVTEVNEKVLTVAEELTNEDNDLHFWIACINYPKGLKSIVAEMIEYDMEASKGAKSETISRHSITYKDIGDGQMYPAEIVAKLSKYCKISV